MQGHLDLRRWTAADHTSKLELRPCVPAVPAQYVQGAARREHNMHHSTELHCWTRASVASNNVDRSCLSSVPARLLQVGRSSSQQSLLASDERVCSWNISGLEPHGHFGSWLHGVSAWYVPGSSWTVLVQLGQPLCLWTVCCACGDCIEPVGVRIVCRRYVFFDGERA